MGQTILACDAKGKFLEYIPKEVGHTGRGRRHLAITVLLYNSKSEVLLQRRKHKIFNNIWDLTGATHPLHKADGTDEKLEETTLRCLEEEWGISPTSPRLRGVKKVGEFNYFAKYGDLCENEHCAMMVVQYDGEITMDATDAYEYKWVEKGEFLKDIEENPKKYSPWAQVGSSYLT